jgi:hypothetical protein
VPKFGVWFENKPFGNPGGREGREEALVVADQK